MGLTEDEAKEKYGDQVVVGQMNMQNVDRTVCEQETAGFAKIVSLGKGRVLGATIVAPTAGELINEIGLAINKELTIEDLALSIHAYPSTGFCLQQIASNVMQDELSRDYPHDGWVRRLFGPATTKVAQTPYEKKEDLE